MGRKDQLNKKTDGSKMFNNSPSREQLEQKIREIARGLYEKRGGGPGHELDDWLEAEKKVKKEAYLRGQSRGSKCVADNRK